MEVDRRFFVILVGFGAGALVFLVIGLLLPSWIVINADSETGSGYVNIGLFTVKGCIKTPIEVCKSMSYGEIDNEIINAGIPEDVAGELNISAGNVVALRALVITSILLLVLGLVSLAATCQLEKQWIKTCIFVSGLLWTVAGILSIAAVSAEGHVGTNIGNFIQAAHKAATLSIQNALNIESQFGGMSGMKNDGSGMSGLDMTNMGNLGQGGMSQSGNIGIPTNGISTPFTGSNFENGLRQTVVQESGIDDVMKQVAAVKINMGCPWALVMVGFGAFFCFILHLLISLWMCKQGGQPGEWHEFSNQC